MAVDVIRLVKGDERPVIVLTLTDDVTGSPIDLSLISTTVSVKFREAGTTTLLSTITCLKVPAIVFDDVIPHCNGVTSKP